MRVYQSLLRRNPEYTKLWIAQVISLMGDWFNTVALLGLVAEYSGGSGLAISLFFILRTLPPLIAGPIAGVLLDRYNRKTLLIWSNLLRALIVPIFLLANNPDLLWLIYLVTVLQFTLASVFEPGQSAIIPALVHSEDILEANTLMSVTWSVMLALGAILGGVFAYFFGANLALIADAVTFACAALLIMTVKYQHETASQSPSEHGHVEDTSFREGLRYIRQTPQVLAGLFVKFGQSLGNIDTIMTILATQFFVIGARGELSLALLWGMFGIGAIVGPLIANRFNDNSLRQLRRLVGVGFVLLVLGWLVLAPATSLALVSFAIFLRATGGSINWTYSNVIIQKTAPDAKLGRMFSIDMIGYHSMTVLSTLVHGYVIDRFGVGQLQAIVLWTALIFLIPLSIWFWGIKKLEQMEAQALVLATGD